MSTSTKTQTKSFAPCHCGCGLVASSGSLYKPGHDAKHVSVLISYIAAGITTVDQAKAQLPTGALRVKLHNALARKARLAEAKAAKQAAKQAANAAAEAAAEAETSWEIKVGRWWYPVTEAANLHDDIFAVVYVDKQGETHEVKASVNKLRQA